MPDAIVRGQRLHYERAGSGPILLLLHGIGSNSRSFRRQLHDLAQGFTTVAWDAPGYGGSDDPPSPFTMADLADDAAALLEQFVDGPAHVLGHSLGGVVAQMLYLRHPERVATLILADTNPGSGSLPEPERSRRVQGRLAAIERQTPRQIAEARGPALLTATAPAELVAEVVEVMAEIRPPGYRAAAIAMGTTDLTHLLPRIAVPTLVIHGEQDAVVPLSTARALAAAIPHAELVILPRAGHASNQERPDAFNAAVRSFLARHPTGTGGDGSDREA